jgi:hypothetical protein
VRGHEPAELIDFFVQPWTAPSGHEYLLPPPRLSARYRLREGTFAGLHCKGQDAPTAAIRQTALKRLDLEP